MTTKLETASRELLEAVKNYAPIRKQIVHAAFNLEEALAEQDSGSVCARCGGIVYDPVIEQTEQKPVAWGCFDADGSFMDALDKQHGAYQTPLYASPISNQTRDKSSPVEPLGNSEQLDRDEIIKLARELVQRYGVRMCDEHGDTHGEELYCVGVEDTAEIIKHAAARKAEIAIAESYRCGYEDGQLACAEAIRARGNNVS